MANVEVRGQDVPTVQLADLILNKRAKAQTGSVTSLLSPSMYRRAPGTASYRGMSRSNSSVSSSRGSLNSLCSSFIRPEIDIEFVEPLDLKYECPVCCQVRYSLIMV